MRTKGLAMSIAALVLVAPAQAHEGSLLTSRSLRASGEIGPPPTSLGRVTSAPGFALGVAVGDVRSTSARIWTRANRPGPVRFLVARSGSGRVVARGTVVATRASDLTVQHVVRRLEPGTDYTYRFAAAGGARSERGRFRTAPRPADDRPVRFAITGDADSAPSNADGTGGRSWNDFEVLGRMAAAGNDFNILNGDTILADPPGNPPAIKDLNNIPLWYAGSVAEKRQVYRETVAMEHYRRLRGAAGMYWLWDDHEFDNDFTIPEHGRRLYEDGRQAYLEYTPSEYSEALGLYRRFRWGRHVELFFLDPRTFRSAKAQSTGKCRNPISGLADVMPTAPADLRARFAPGERSLVAPVSPECLAVINDPSRTILGRAQLERFKRDVAGSTATWKLIVTAPFMQFYTGPYDRFEGYEAERQEVLRFLRDNVANAVTFSNDQHFNVAVDARLSTLERGKGPVDSGVTEISSGPNAMCTEACKINFNTNFQFAANGTNSLLYMQPTPVGLGFACSQIDLFSYAQIEVSHDRLVAEFRDDRGRTVTDPLGRPCAPVVIDAEAGPRP
jgi:alkaline phosphatase D